MKRFLVEIQSTHGINAILLTVHIDGKKVEQQRIVIPEDGRAHVWRIEGGDVQISEMELE